VKVMMHGLLPDMVDENETYEYEVTWSVLSPIVVTRRIGHGIIFKINYKVEDEGEDDIDHDRTPRWIESVHFKGKVSQDSEQVGTVS